MKVKKLIVFTLLAILLLSTFACGGGGEEEEATPTPTAELTAEEVRGLVIAAYDEMETWETGMDVVMEMQITEFGESGELTHTMDFESVIDASKRRMRFDMEIYVEMTGEPPQHIRVETYIVDDYVYTNTVVPAGQPPGWVKSAMPEGYWEQFDALLQLNNILPDVEVDLLGTDIVEGTECYVLDMTAALEELLAMKGLWAAVAGPLPPGFDFEELIADYSLTAWVAKDTFFPLKTSSSMEMVLTSESPGMPPGVVAEDFDAVLNAEAIQIYRNINQPVSIELPPGAEEAEEVPVP